MKRLVGLAAACGLVACGLEPLPPPDSALSVGSEEVLYEAFEAYLLGALGEGDAAIGSDVLSGLFDQFLDELLLRRLIEEEPPPGTAADGDPLLALLETLPSRPPSEAEIGDYYSRHLSEFVLPERVRLRQILVDEAQTARVIHAELLAGVDFGELADRHARHEFTPAGGDQGVLAREDLPPAFAEAVFALRDGEFSDVVAAEYGFHLFQVVEHLAPRQVPLDEARARIASMLSRRAADAELAELVERARNRYNVRVHRRNLPFNYAGRYADAEHSNGNDR